MGTVGSSFPGDNGSILADIIKPADDGWVSRHANECKIPESDVEVLWKQFQKLGCSDSGVLNKDNLTDAEPMATKIFKEFPANASGEVTFQTFCNASKWYSTADTEARIRAVFCTLNNSNPIDQAILDEILDEIYTDSSKEVRERLGRVFMEQVDTKKQGFIDEDEFVDWVKNMPQDVIRVIMEFNPEQSEEEQPSRSQSKAGDSVTDAELTQIAKEAGNEDWVLFANKLAFTADDVKAIEEKFPEKQDQLSDILQQWKQREGENASLTVLKDHLKDAGLSSVVDKL